MKNRFFPSIGSGDPKSYLRRIQGAPKKFALFGLDILEKESVLISMNEAPPESLRSSKIDVRLKLSALWIVYMFVFTYTDYYKLFMPGVVNDMMKGITEGTQLTQASLLITSIITIIPALMIFLSLIVLPKINRWLNIVVGVLYVGISVYSLIGHTWAFWMFYCTLLFLVAGLIVVYSWKWPKADLNDKRK